MYHTIIAVLIGVIALLHIVFAFATPPKALEPFVGWSSRKLRAYLGFIPESYRTQATRLVVGLCLMVASSTILLR